MTKSFTDRIQSLERAKLAGLFAVLLLALGFAGLALVQWQGREDAETGEQQATEKADAGQESLEELCRAGNRSACHAVEELESIDLGEAADPDPDDPEVQDLEIQEPEIQDPERQDPEKPDPERDDQDPDDPEAQDDETQDGEVDDPEIQDPEEQDAEIQDPEIDDPDPNDPPVCAGEFVCQSELDAAIANFVTLAQVIALINERIAPLGCEVTVGGNGPPLVLDCTITGKP